MNSSAAATSAAAAAQNTHADHFNAVTSPPTTTTVTTATTATTDLPSASLPDLPSPPLRRTVSSASELPTREIKAAVFGHHVASDQYVEHHRRALEAMRETHRQERIAWNIERQELLVKVADLEAKTKRLQAFAVDGIGLSGTDSAFGNYTITRSASTPGDFVSGGGPSAAIGGEERGTKGRQSMQSIPEESEADRVKSVTFAAGELPDADINKALEGVTIPGHLIDKDLDGIPIKATSLPAATKKAILEDTKSDTPSPLFSPGAQAVDSPSLKRPVTIEIPSTQQVLQLPAKDLYKHAAGNTPLARLADHDEGSGVETEVATPKGAVVTTIESEKPPLEPHPSTLDARPIRPPNERSDSYFNVPLPAAASYQSENVPPQSQPSTNIDDDPALTGPLSMPNRPPLPRNAHGSQGESNEFLDKLDEKLTSLSRRQSKSNTTSPQEQDDNSTGMTDPPLRIRRSINFGSQLGQGPRS